MAQQSVAHTEAQIEQAAALQAHLAGDRHRPRYHFMPPAAWMNDINGALFWRGRYHIFYQFNPHGAYWHRIQWGHASSVDLVHWVHHPVALEPDPQGPDRVGCFSGGALVSKEGVPTFIYFGNPDGICLASSDDDLLIRWTRHPDNPVIPQPREGDADFGRYEVHDPCAWLAGDTYYAAVNRRHPNGAGDAAFCSSHRTCATGSSSTPSTSHAANGRRRTKIAPSPTSSPSVTATCCCSAAICRPPSTTSASCAASGSIPGSTAA